MTASRRPSPRSTRGCGLTVPGLLHHVGSKDGLLVAVPEHRDTEDGRSLAAQLGLRPSASPADWTALARTPDVDLRRVCAALVRRNATQPEIVQLFAVLEAESLAPDHPAHDHFATRQAQTLDVFTELARPLSDDPRTLARQVIAMMNGLQIQWLRAPAETDLVDAWDAAAATLFG
jgi:hypothetical protein